MKKIFLLLSLVFILNSCSSTGKMTIPLENSGSVEVSTGEVNYQNDKNDINVSTNGINGNVEGVGDINITTGSVEAGGVKVTSSGVDMSGLDMESLLNSTLEEASNTTKAEEVNLSDEQTNGMIQNGSSSMMLSK